MAIEIPFGDEVLEIEVADLAEGKGNVLDLLADVRTAPEVYLQISFACLNSNAKDLYKTFLTAGYNNTRGVHDVFRLLIINLLAADILEQLVLDKTNELYHSEFRTYIAEAETIGKTDKFTLLNLSNYSCIKGDHEAALKGYQQILKKEPAYAPALKAEAKIHLYLGQYEEALSSLQSVFLLEEQKNCSLLLDIAVCYNKLGMLEESAFALQRILEIEPQNLEASILLSSVFFNIARLNLELPGADNKTLASQSNEILISVGRKGKKYAQFLISIAYRLFLAGEYDESLKVYEDALKICRRKAYIAHIHFVRSVISQIRGEYDDATKAIMKCVDAVSHYPQYKYALALMQIYKGKIDDAEKFFKILYERGVTDLFFLLQFAYFARAKSDMKLVSSLINSAINNWKSAEEYSQKDLLIIADISSLLPPKYAYVIHENILEALKAKGIQGSAEFYNNFGVLLFGKGFDFALNQEYGVESKEFIKLALDNFNEAKSLLTSDTTADGESIIKFNIARIIELHDIVKAKSLYEEIIDKRPEFLECKMRLIDIARRMNGVTSALKLSKELSSQKIESLDSKLQYANLLTYSKNYAEAKKVLDGILKNTDGHDSYALCLLGNLNLKFAADHPQEKQNFLERAWKLFEAALHRDQNNLYAAIGISVVTAECGFYDNARTMMSELEQLNTGNRFIAQNFGHVYINQNVRLGRTAIALYNKAIKLEGRQEDPNLLVALSLAYYVVAKEERDPAAMRNSLSIIQRASLMKPGDLTIQLNLALVKQQLSQILNEQPVEDRSLLELKSSMKGVDSAERIFKGLAAMEHPSYSKKYATLRADFCEKVKLTATRKIRESSVLLKQREDRMAMITGVGMQ